MMALLAAAGAVAVSYAIREAFLAGRRSKPDPHALLIDDSALRIRLPDQMRTLVIPDPDDTFKRYMRTVPHPSYVSSIKFMDVSA